MRIICDSLRCPLNLRCPLKLFRGDFRRTDRFSIEFCLLLSGLFDQRVMSAMLFISGKYCLFGSLFFVLSLFGFNLLLCLECFLDVLRTLWYNNENRLKVERNFQSFLLFESAFRVGYIDHHRIRAISSGRRFGHLSAIFLNEFIDFGVDLRSAIRSDLPIVVETANGNKTGIAIMEFPGFNTFFAQCPAQGIGFDSGHFESRNQVLVGVGSLLKRGVAGKCRHSQGIHFLVIQKIVRTVRIDLFDERVNNTLLAVIFFWNHRIGNSNRSSQGTKTGKFLIFLCQCGKFLG